METCTAALEGTSEDNSPGSLRLEESTVEREGVEESRTEECDNLALRDDADVQPFRRTVLFDKLQTLAGQLAH